jgi:hypothetical protein
LSTTTFDTDPPNPLYTALSHQVEEGIKVLNKLKSRDNIHSLSIWKVCSKSRTLANKIATIYGLLMEAHTSSECAMLAKVVTAFDRLSSSMCHEPDQNSTENMDLNCKELEKIIETISNDLDNFPPNDFYSVMKNGPVPGNLIHLAESLKTLFTRSMNC